MFHIQGNIQVYSPFGSFVVEQHGVRSYVEDLPRPDVKLGKDHPLARSEDDRRAA